MGDIVYRFDGERCPRCDARTRTDGTDRWCESSGCWWAEAGGVWEMIVNRARKAVAAERAAVVAWLRMGGPDQPTLDACEAANAIERGDHIRGAS
jgi:hypothetical protein